MEQREEPYLQLLESPISKFAPDRNPSVLTNHTNCYACEFLASIQWTLELSMSNNRLVFVS